jgi:hypothetical protein
MNFLLRYVYSCKVPATAILPYPFVHLIEKTKVLVWFHLSGKMEEFFKKTNLWTSLHYPIAIGSDSLPAVHLRRSLA